jgi:hypothetical protein
VLLVWLLYIEAGSLLLPYWLLLPRRQVLPLLLPSLLGRWLRHTPLPGFLPFLLPALLLLHLLWVIMLHVWLWLCRIPLAATLVLTEHVRQLLLLHVLWLVSSSIAGALLLVLGPTANLRMVPVHLPCCCHRTGSPLALRPSCGCTANLAAWRH